MTTTTVVPKRSLSNGLVVLVRELHIKDPGAVLSWFELGMIHRKEGVNPCEYIPKTLKDQLDQAHDLEDPETSINTLLKIGDWMAGWIWSQMNA